MTSNTLTVSHHTTTHHAHARRSRSIYCERSFLDELSIFIQRESFCANDKIPALPSQLIILMQTCGDARRRHHRRGWPFGRRRLIGSSRSPSCPGQTEGGGVRSSW